MSITKAQTFILALGAFTLILLSSLPMPVSMYFLTGKEVRVYCGIGSQGIARQGKLNLDGSVGDFHINWDKVLYVREVK